MLGCCGKKVLSLSLSLFFFLFLSPWCAESVRGVCLGVRGCTESVLWVFLGVLTKKLKIVFALRVVLKLFFALCAVCVSVKKDLLFFAPGAVCVSVEKTRFFFSLRAVSKFVFALCEVFFSVCCSV